MDGNKMPARKTKIFFVNTIKFNSPYYFSYFNLNIVTQFLNGFFECWIERGRWIDSCDFSSADNDDDACQSKRQIDFHYGQKSNLDALAPAIDFHN